MMANKIERYDELGCKMLAAAIVEQAAKDAKGCKDSVYRGKGALNQIKEFFCDPDSPFIMYMPNTDGKALYDKIMSNYNKYGDYKPPMDKGENAG